MNDITVVGRLTGEPKFSQTKNGEQVANFSVAENIFAGYDENHKAITTPLYHNVVAFGPAAEFMQKNKMKGREYEIKGEMIPNNYTNKNGVEVKSYKIKAEVIKNGRKPASQKKAS